MTPSPSSSRKSPRLCPSRSKPPPSQSSYNNDTRIIETSQSNTLTKNSFLRPKAPISQIGRQNAIQKYESIEADLNLSTNFRQQLTFKKGGSSFSPASLSASSTPKRNDSKELLNPVIVSNQKLCKSFIETTKTKHSKIQRNELPIKSRVLNLTKSVEFPSSYSNHDREPLECNCSVHEPPSSTSIIEGNIKANPRRATSENISKSSLNPSLKENSIHKKPKENLSDGSSYPKVCKLHVEKKAKSLHKNLSRNSFFFVAAEIHDDSNDYNPLKILENDIFLYKDFCLPNYFASQEDTSIV
jgi:hypothetical protein